MTRTIVRINDTGIYRSVVGSVSLHQATAEFYPVLIVRPREA